MSRFETSETIIGRSISTLIGTRFSWSNAPTKMFLGARSMPRVVAPMLGLSKIEAGAKAAYVRSYAVVPEYRDIVVPRTVKTAYLEVLGREADSAGLRFYTSKMTESGWNDSRIRDALKKSPEYANRTRIGAPRGEPTILPPKRPQKNPTPHLNPIDPRQPTSRPNRTARKLKLLPPNLIDIKSLRSLELPIAR